MYKIVLKLLLFFLAFSLISAQLGLAQTRDDFAKTIQRLDNRLNRAKELVRSFDSRRALELVERAQKLRDEAVSAAQTNNLVEATAKVRLAFSLLEQAAKITLEGPIKRMRSQLEELLRKADDLVLKSRNKEAQRILDEAKKNRVAAENAVSAMQIERAVEHYRVAIMLAERSLSLVSNSGNLNFDRILDERRKFENLRERARDFVDSSGDNRARRIFQQAINMSRSAEEAYRKGNIELAKKFYNQSILLLLRSMDLASGETPGAENQAELALFRLRDLMEDSRDVLSQSDKPRANRLFERARRFANEAQIAIQEGRGYEALWKIELAENMVQRARRIAENGVRRQYSNKINEEIENTKNEISAVQSTMTSDSPKDAEILIKMSQFTINKAEKAAQAGLNRAALEAVLASQRFLTRAERILRAQETSSTSREQIQVRFNQLDAAIAESEDRILDSSQDWSKQLLQSAKEIRQISYESFQKGNYRAANEGIQVSFELLRKSLRNVPKN